MSHQLFERKERQFKLARRHAGGNDQFAIDRRESLHFDLDRRRAVRKVAEPE
jgi:hypothetical protein